MVFNWLKGAIQRKFSDMQRKEVVQFTEMLDGADDEEVALVVALATNFRHSNTDWFEFLDPIANSDTGVPIQLVRLYQQLQKQGRPELAPGVAVWLHTMRAVHALENRGHVRRMWAVLSRGFPYVEEAASDFECVIGETLNTDEYDKFPIGFEPMGR